MKKLDIDIIIHLLEEMQGEYLQYKASTTYLQQYSSINQDICKRTLSAPDAFIPLQVKGQFSKAHDDVLTTFVCKYEEAAIKLRDIWYIDILTKEGDFVDINTRLRKTFLSPRQCLEIPMNIIKK